MNASHDLKVLTAAAVQMMSACLAACIAVLGGGSWSRLVAQATCTATAMAPLSVTSSLGGVRTQPAGGLPDSLRLLSSAAGEQASLSSYKWQSAYLPPGGAGWRLAADLNINLQATFGAYRAVSATGQILLHLQSQVPVDGLLYLLPEFDEFGPLQVYSGDITVDIDANGVPDYGALGRSPVAVEIPITLDANGRNVVVDINMSASWFLPLPGTMSGSAMARWDVVFLPGTFGIERRGAGCVPMNVIRDPFSIWQRWIGASINQQFQDPLVAAVFLLGLAEQNTTQPVPPNCSLLVANPAIVMPTYWNVYTLGLTLPELPLPPGLTFYCQAAWLNSANELILTDSIRTL